MRRNIHAFRDNAFVKRRKRREIVPENLTIPIKPASGQFASPVLSLKKKAGKPVDGYLIWIVFLSVAVGKLIKVKPSLTRLTHSLPETEGRKTMTAGRIDRFQFLRGDFSGRQAVIRPPWSVEEDGFIAQCSRCHACIHACPEKTLIKGRGGFPEINFSLGECTFCQRCVEVCETSALRIGLYEPWTIRAEIVSECLTFQGVLCRTCGECCEVGAIRFRPVIGGAEVPILDKDLCTGCGACVAPCPTGAIRMGTPPAKEESVA